MAVSPKAVVISILVVTALLVLYMKMSTTYLNSHFQQGTPDTHIGQFASEIGVDVADIKKLMKEVKADVQREHGLTRAVVTASSSSPQGLELMANETQKMQKELSELKSKMAHKDAVLATYTRAAIAPPGGLPGATQNAVFTAIFGFGKDPQTGKPYEKDNPNHVKRWPWAESVQKLGVEHGIVLHDDVYSPGFVGKIRDTVPSLKSMEFIYANVTEAGLYGNPERKELTAADWRFVAFHDYLKANRHKLRYVLLTDSHDVFFRKDPLKYMEEHDKLLGHKYLYGQEEWRPWYRMNLHTQWLFSTEDAHIMKGKELEDTPWGRLLGYWNGCFGTPMPREFAYGRMMNCAIIGGHVDAVIPFMERMLKHYAQVPPAQRFLMCDMLVYIRTVMEDYNDRFIAGYPWHAKFKINGAHEAAVVYHKAYLSEEPPNVTLPDPMKHLSRFKDRHVSMGLDTSRCRGNWC